MFFIRSDIVVHIKNISHSNHREEICGLLISSKSDNTIDEFIQIPNISPNAEHEFEFDPSTFIKVLYHIENEKKEWIGVIHSHPTSLAYPSSIDIKNWFYPEISYWIYSVLDQQLKVYSIKKDAVKELQYQIF